MECDFHNSHFLGANCSVELKQISNLLPASLKTEQTKQTNEQTNKKTQNKTNKKKEKKLFITQA